MVLCTVEERTTADPKRQQTQQSKANQIHASQSYGGNIDLSTVKLYEHCSNLSELIVELLLMHDNPLI